MQIAVFAAAFIIVAGILGRFFTPTEEQLRPLAPEPGAAGDAHDSHDAHGAHGAHGGGHGHH